MAAIAATSLLVTSSLGLTASAAETCAGKVATITGTEGADRIKGTNGADVILGLGGNDKIDGRKGDDVICGGAGDDDLRGHVGNDQLDGGPGSNSLTGGAGQDACLNGARTSCETTPTPTPSPSTSPSDGNQAPTVTTQSSTRSYTEDDGSDRAIDNQLRVTDPDSTQLQSAVIRITENFNAAEDELRLGNPDWVSGSYDDTTGTLTITGVATVAQYQDALASSSYHNSSHNPSGTKTVTFQVTDVEGASSNIASRTIELHSTNDDPFVTTSEGSTNYTEGDPATIIDGALTVTDLDDVSLEGGSVVITQNFEAGDELVFVNQSGISGSYNAATGVLTLSGIASVSDYQAALRSIRYRHTGDNPATSKAVEFKVNDGGGDSSFGDIATKSLAITRT